MYYVNWFKKNKFVPKFSFTHNVTTCKNKLIFEVVTHLYSITVYVHKTRQVNVNPRKS